MLTFEKISELNDVFEDVLGFAKGNAMARLSPRIDVESPTQHSSKKEFKAELSLVEQSLEHVDALLGLHLDQNNDADDVKATRRQLEERIDKSLLNTVSAATVGSAFALIREGVKLSGATLAMVVILADYRLALSGRLKELKDQEKEFWSTGSRPPNYHARVIALRTARLFASQTGEKPTYGTYRDGGHPSTKYGQALGRIFAILEIDAQIRGPAQWAIANLSEEDTEKPLNTFFWDNAPVLDPDDSRLKIAQMLMRKPDAAQ